MAGPREGRVVLESKDDGGGGDDDQPGAAVPSSESASRVWDGKCQGKQADGQPCPFFGNPAHGRLCSQCWLWTVPAAAAALKELHDTKAALAQATAKLAAETRVAALAGVVDAKTMATLVDFVSSADPAAFTPKLLQARLAECCLSADQAHRLCDLVQRRKAVHWLHEHVIYARVVDRSNLKEAYGCEGYFHGPDIVDRTKLVLPADVAKLLW